MKRVRMASACSSYICVALTIGCLLGGSAALRSQELFRSQMNTGVGWSVTSTDIDATATFGYNYSADDIPEAPNGRPGDAATTGLKLEANLAPPSAPSVIAVFPDGESFTGSYELRFDAWCNYDADERINGIGSGTAEFIGGGIGYDSASADVGSGVEILATGDEGSSNDWRAFADGSLLDAGEMAGDDRNGVSPYYIDFLPGVSPPAGQNQVSFPAGSPGSPGFQWITFVLTTYETVAILHIEKPNGERLQIAHYYQLDRPFTSAGNVSLRYADLFSSVTSRPDLTFGVIDNVEVRQVTAPTAPCENPSSDVSDCSFEDPMLAAWTLVSGDLLAQSSRPARSGIGSAEVDAQDNGLGAFEMEIRSDCFAVSSPASPDYAFGVSIRLTSGAFASGSCTAGIRVYSEASCTALIDEGAGNVVGPDSTTWLRSEGFVDASGSTFGMLRLVCSDTGEDFVLQIDDSYAEAAIFRDGFESGSTVEWSAAIP